MPVIRQAIDRLPKEQRSLLLDELRKTLEDPKYSALGGPVIFEIPFTGTRYEVLVVWDQWEGVQPDERTEIISEAYGDGSIEIAQAMGVTFIEAAEDHLLPYEVRPRDRGEGEANRANLRKAMMEEGAIARGEDVCLLRFPTRRMAEEAYERLNSKMPEGCWILVSY
jgi:hypothetical protein